jgi:predicted AAA+ superfamily ATPase
MNLLEILHESRVKNLHFYDRKIKIKYKKMLILGPRKSGKTHLVVDYLQKFDTLDYLYIDFNDQRIDTKELSNQKLNEFIKKNHIKILVLDNFDFSFKVPICEEIIITTDNTSTKLSDYYTIHLYPLDFEEFIAFDKKHFEAEQLFNLFSNRGGLPEVAVFNEENYYTKLQSIVKDIFESQSEFYIFKKFCEMQSTKVSLFQIFNQLKTKIKISKDLLYSVSQNLQERELIFLLKKYKQEKSAKKVYIFDFAIKNSLTLKKDFLKRFENMVFLELYKKEKNLYYSDYVDFYIKDKAEGIICSLFTPLEALEKKMQKIKSHLKDINITKISIITLGNEGSFVQNDIQFTLIPFWDWALGD